MKLLKVLRSDLRSPFQNFQFELGKKYHCYNFDNSKVNGCSYGFYATDVEGLLYSLNSNKNNRVFQVEVGGKKVEIDQFKRRYEYIEIIKEVTLSEIKKMAKRKEKKLGYKLSEALFPFNPLQNKISKVYKKDINNLIKWGSIRQSIRQSIKNSIGHSLEDSIRYSIKYSLEDSIGHSLEDSIRYNIGYSIGNNIENNIVRGTEEGGYAYMSSFFPEISKWKYINHKKGINPFQCGVDLWYRGLVPSFDGKTWHLRSGKNAEIVYTMKQK